MVSVPGIQAYEDPDSVEPNAEIEEDDFQDIFPQDIIREIHFGGKLKMICGEIYITKSIPIVQLKFRIQYARKK